MPATSVATRSRRLAIVAAVAAVAVLGLPAASQANTTSQSLPFSQDWTDAGLITVSDDWSGVPGIVGYRGDGLTTATGVDPQTVVADGSAVPDVNANQTSPNTFTTGGVAEFAITDPTVALQGSGTARAPQLVLHIATTGASNVHVSYNLRDIDGAADNAVHQVALQYRVDSAGNFTNVPAGYVADATTGPSLATLVTPISVTLPPAVNNQPDVQVRIITTDAVGSDEWVGVDDISVTGGPAEVAPSVASTSPADGALGVPLDANVDVTFSEDVDASGAWFDIDCDTSGTHAAIGSGGPSTFTLDPEVDFATGETCTVTIVATQIADQDTDDPPDTMDSDHVFSFQTLLEITPIHDIQGAAHLSSLEGTAVRTTGIVTAERTNGFWMQDPTPDADDATSEGIFVFTSSAPTVDAGVAVEVTGTVEEFRPGGAISGNLTTTEITSPTVVVVSTSNPLPAATVVGSGGRVPPTTVIEDDAAGDVETSGVFDPASDGIDFYESLEGMRLRVSGAVASGPTNDFGEISVLVDDGAAAGLRTGRGGIIVRANDFNPERIILDDVLADTPDVNTGDHFTADIVGILDYSFGNFKLYPTSAVTGVDEGLVREVGATPSDLELSIATLNVENLDPSDGTKFADLAGLVVDNLASPDLLTLEEVQDNNGPTNDAVVAANVTLDMLVAAIADAGGPDYEWRQIDPVDDQDGGEPGGNIRVAFLFRTDRGLSFVDRAGGGSTTAVSVVSGADGPELSISPGRLDPANPAFTTSRKPLAGEFEWNGRSLFVVANHWNSKGGDEPLFGQHQPPTLVSEVQRIQQAQVVHDFVDEILSIDPSANIVVAGDLNDFAFSAPLTTVTAGGILDQLADTLPAGERYSYVFDGNSQQLDHILTSDNMTAALSVFDFVHVNAEFDEQVSDHDPAYATFRVASPDCDILGTNGDDTLLGTDGPDHICALKGADTVRAGAGDDIVEGANGDDTLVGGPGNDLLIGWNGADSLVGGPGSDVLRGGNAADVFDAQDGFANDEVEGGPGADECSDVDPGDVVTGC